MNIKKIFKGLDKKETIALLMQCKLSVEELPIAISIFADENKRNITCDNCGLSLGKYHYMLNRVNSKIEIILKLKLFEK